VSLLTAFLIFGGWLFAAGIIACFFGMVLGFNPDTPSLLVQFADTRDQRHLLDLALAEDREVAELDAVYELPSFGGWRS
jgi:hypothetical protein